MLTISLFAFYILNSRTANSLLTGYSNSIYLIAEKEAELIQMKFFRNDALFQALDNDRFPDLKGRLKAVQGTYPFFETLELVRKPLFFSGHDYLIQATEDNRLYFNFRVTQYRGKEFIDDMYLRMAFDMGGLFDVLNVSRDFILSDGLRSWLFLYGLRIKPVNPPVTLQQIILGIVQALLMAVIARRILRKYHSYYYSTEGLEKIIFLFEKTEEYSANHSRNVAEISHYLGKKLNLKRKRLKDLKTAAYLHDIGKISVPVAILNKNGRLSKDEFGSVKNHVTYSAEIINNFEGLSHLRDFILCHHEKMDGSGYPRGLAGEEIPLESRIISVADIFEALVGERPYRASVNRHTAVEEMGEMPLDREILIILRENLDEIYRLTTYRRNFPVGRTLII